MIRQGEGKELIAAYYSRHTQVLQDNQLDRLIQPSAVSHCGLTSKRVGLDQGSLWMILGHHILIRLSWY